MCALLYITEAEGGEKEVWAKQTHASLEGPARYMVKEKVVPPAGTGFSQ